MRWSICEAAAQWGGCYSISQVQINFRFRSRSAFHHRNGIIGYDNKKTRIFVAFCIAKSLKQLAFDVVGVDDVDDNIGDCGGMMWMLMIMRAGAAATSIWLF